MLKVIFEEGSPFLVSRGISVETSKTTRQPDEQDQTTCAFAYR